MTFQSRNVNPQASLELSLAVHKSLVSDYALRAQQAEQAASRCISQSQQTWTDQQVQMFAALINQHLERRSTERAVQQQAILQATVVALNAVLQTEDHDKQQDMLKTMLRELTASVQHLKDYPNRKSESPNQ